MIDRHDPVRRDVAWNGRAYIGTCRHCGAQIQRQGRRDWRKRKDATELDRSSKA